MSDGTAAPAERRPAVSRKKRSQLPREHEIIRYLRTHFSRPAPLLRQGIGDDAAVISPAGAREHWVVTTDMLLEGVDFQRRWLTAKDLGHKSLAANLSDLAAMGAVPRFHVVALGLPRDLSRRWVHGFYEGMASLGDRYETSLIGGDLSRSPDGIHISITAIGETAGRRAVGRAGARPGDILYVTGTLGKSASGLKLLQAERLSGRTASERAALKSHRRPEPRCDVGVWLSGTGTARAMIDLSDGLSSDLLQLCEAGAVGALIEEWRLPLFVPSAEWGCDPLDLALHGGEDFELLFAVPPRKEATLRRAYSPGFPPATAIGHVTDRGGVMLQRSPGGAARLLAARGYDHFAR